MRTGWRSLNKENAECGTLACTLGQMSVQYYYLRTLGTYLA